MYKTLILQPSYFSDEDDIANEFYIPVLEKTVKYDRVSAYFSFKALVAYSKGIEGLIRNNGKMRFIISHEISYDDYEILKGGYALKKTLVPELAHRDYHALSLEEQRNISNFAHLIAQGVIDIKMGFTHNGIFHSKYGICEDTNGNFIYFNGSNNETAAAITKNYEAFDVTASWKSAPFDLQRLFRAIERFEQLWQGSSKNSFVFVKDIDEVIKQQLIRYDKGKLILNATLLTPNSLILDYANEQFIVHDNVTSYTIKGTESIFQSKLFAYLDGGFPNFEKNLTHLHMQDIIKHIKKFAERKKFEVVVTETLQQFISQKAYYIRERADYGKAIKYYQKDVDPVITERFEAFKAIAVQAFARPPRDVQLWCAFYMYEMQRASNFSVPGAGKTTMAYLVFSYLTAPEIDQVDKIVMFGPKNSFLAWKQEFGENFGANKELRVLDVQRYKYSPTEFMTEAGKCNVILVNYEAVAKYQGVLTHVINDRTMLILDEVHKIKGIQSARAQSVMDVSKRAKFKYALTGTPIPNSYEDIYNLLKILYDEEYALYFNFRKDQLKNPNAVMMERINDLLYPFFWRTTKAELQVPPSNENDLRYVVATDQEQELLNLLYRKYGHSVFHLYIRLIQASVNPSLLLNSIDYIEMYGDDADNNMNPWHAVDPEKIEFTKQEISLIQSLPKTSKYFEAIDLASSLHHEQKQTIIWCIFVDTMLSLESDLRQLGIRAKVIYGSTKQQERDVIIKQFLKKEIDVLITNPHTLGESVSLHHTCHDAIYLEYSFNLTHLLQSRDRIHRLGLKEDAYTQYYFLMLQGQPGERGTIDERIYYRLKDKEDRMLAAIERGMLTPDPMVNLADIIALFD
ncbi:superfamily II DNA or RNA helicase [Priestia aryabhattai]|uniref:SNF2-related protein n=1 Tax=Priestia aryabhattai TaxID=412384 RepID=UPI0027E3DD4B|nr:SNF2-related protein [Priestia aryabhattai]MDP9726006.1 superfamily II DNA or RNA helicase [Priestia aryabhattai]